LQNYFRPEFLNRIDELIIFNPISKVMLKNIVEIQLEQFKQKILKDKNIKINLTEKAKDFLSQK